MPSLLLLLATHLWIHFFTTSGRAPNTTKQHFSSKFERALRGREQDHHDATQIKNEGIINDSKNILFMCVANSARSQMAESIARLMAPEGVEITAPGPNPAK